MTGGVWWYLFVPNDCVTGGVAGGVAGGVKLVV